MKTSKKLKPIRIANEGRFPGFLADWLKGMTAKQLTAECKARGVGVPKYKAEMAARLANDIIARRQKIELRIG